MAPGEAPARCRDHWPRTARAWRAAPARSRDRRAARHREPPSDRARRESGPATLRRPGRERAAAAWTRRRGTRRGARRRRRPRAADARRASVSRIALSERPDAARRATRSIGPVSSTSTAAGSIRSSSTTTRSSRVSAIPWSLTTTRLTPPPRPRRSRPVTSRPTSRSAAAAAASACGAWGPSSCEAASTRLKYSIASAGRSADGRANHSSTRSTRASCG